jgi:hypothetical protein
MRSDPHYEGNCHIAQKMKREIQQETFYYRRRSKKSEGNVGFIGIGFRRQHVVVICAFASGVRFAKSACGS